jgi:hypothetical protein
MSNFTAISARAAAIGAKAQAGQATQRDIAELAELYQQAIDAIDELIDEPYQAPDLLARIDGGTTVKFADADKLATWISGVMHGN